MARLDKIVVNAEIVFRNQEAMEALAEVEEIVGEITEGQPWMIESCERLSELLDVVHEHTEVIVDKPLENLIQEDGFEEGDDDDHPYTEYYSCN
jgi:hypothetical protein